MNHRRPGIWMCGLGSWLVLACCGCATLGERGQPLVPTACQTRTGPYVVFSNKPIKPDASAIRSLQTLERDIDANLGIRVRDEKPSVQVYILDDRQSFMHFLRYYYPELPPRRAFFVARGEERHVYTFMGERLDEDLRHEATHALLHVAVGDLPLWLDEGLAEYFEGPEGWQGSNPEHLDRLPQDRIAGWAPDLARLETLTLVSQMAPRDYRESWAWIHYLLNHSPATKAALLGYLADLHTNPQALRLSERLKASDAAAPERLLVHIDKVRNRPVVATPAPANPTIRLQDNAIEPPRPSQPRRNLLDRFRTFFGLG
jgi:hypothetical protein